MSDIPALKQILFVRDYLDYKEDHYSDVENKSEEIAQQKPGIKKKAEEKGLSAVIANLLKEINSKSEDVRTIVSIFGLPQGTTRISASMLGEKLLKLATKKKDLLEATQKIKQSSLSLQVKARLIQILYVRDYLDYKDHHYTKVTPENRNKANERGLSTVVKALLDTINSDRNFVAEIVRIFNLPANTDKISVSLLGEKILTKKDSIDDLITAICTIDGSESFCPAITGITITGIANSRINRGSKDIEITISGNNLPTENPSVDLGPGVKIKNIEVVSDKEIKIKIDVEPGAAEGVRNLKLSTTDGFLPASYPNALTILPPVELRTFKIYPVTTTPAEVFPGSQVVLKIQAGDDVDNGLKIRQAELFPAGITDLRRDAREKTISTDTLTIPKNAKPGYYTFELLGENDKILGRFIVNVKQPKIPFSQKVYDNVIKPARLEVKARGALHTSVNPAFEGRLPHNLSTEVSVNPQLVGPDGIIKKTKKVEVSVKAKETQDQNFHLGRRDTYRTALELSAEARLTLHPNVQPFASVGYKFSDQQFVAPSPFYPDGMEHRFQLKVGSRFPITDNYVVSSYYKYETGHFYSRQFADAAGERFEYDGAEGLHSGGITVEAKFSPKVKARLLVEAGHGFTDTPGVFAVSSAAGSTRQMYITKSELTQVQVAAALELGQWSILFDYASRMIKDWATEQYLSGGVSLNTEKAGRFTLRYDWLKAEPNVPTDLHGPRMIWQLPWWNRAVSLEGYVYREGDKATRGGAGFSLDLIALYERIFNIKKDNVVTANAAGKPAENPNSLLEDMQRASLRR
jgi:hypothetical protein